MFTLNDCVIFSFMCFYEDLTRNVDQLETIWRPFLRIWPKKVSVNISVMQLTIFVSIIASFECSTVHDGIISIVSMT